MDSEHRTGRAGCTRCAGGRLSDSPQYEAFREFARATIALEVLKATQPLQEEIRSLRTQLETRSAQQGPAGRDGAPGKDGANGKDGTPGVQGEHGPAGKDGAPGPQGDKGERGADGLQGRDGTSGKDGKDGSLGERGPQGERGADGLQGRDGATGKDGERGVDGLATVGEIEAVVEKRNAEVQVRTFADVYQGVYENNKLYARGVLVTWGGSLWLSLADTQAKPGENGEWRLVVKKGADGRK